MIFCYQFFFDNKQTNISYILFGFCKWTDRERKFVFFNVETFVMVSFIHSPKKHTTNTEKQSKAENKVTMPDIFLFSKWKISVSSDFFFSIFLYGRHIFSQDIFSLACFPLSFDCCIYTLFRIIPFFCCCWIVMSHKNRRDKQKFLFLDHGFGYLWKYKKVIAEKKHAFEAHTRKRLFQKNENFICFVGRMMWWWWCGLDIIWF